MLIYLDNCSFNRPFDDQKQERIHQETIAKLQIQEGILQGIYFLAWSYILDYENAENPFSERKAVIANWKRRAKMDTGETSIILQYAHRFQSRNIGAKDALHLASAVVLGCNFFITTDDFLIRKCSNFDEMKVLNPIAFLNQTK